MLQRDALKRGYIASTVQNNGIHLTPIILGATGFAALLVLGMLLYWLCKRCKSGPLRWRRFRHDRYIYLEDEGESFNNSNISSLNSDTSSQSTMRGRKDIFAPAGKIGIIIGTSKYGPIIESIKSDSPLIGKVFPGDYVLAIDNVDTSDWLAENVAKLVAAKTDCVKKLTLLSKHWDDVV